MATLKAVASGIDLGDVPGEHFEPIGMEWLLDCMAISRKEAEELEELENGEGGIDARDPSSMLSIVRRSAIN